MRSNSPDVPPQRPASADDIDLAMVGAAIRRHAPKLAVAAAIAATAALLVSSMMTPKFTAQAQIEIISKGVGNPFEPRREGGTPENVTVRMDKEAIGTHVRAMLSPDLAVKVVRDLKLDEKPEFNAARREPTIVRRVINFFTLNARESDEDRALKAYTEAARVYQVKDTRGIVVEFSSTDPELSARAANRIVALYRDALATRSVSDSNDARAKLSPQILKLAAEVADAEAAVTRFRGQSNIFDGGRERTGLNEQQLADLSADLTRTAALRADAEARAREARIIARQGGGETLPDVQKSQLLPRLIEQRVRAERQISELSASLLPAHPRMKQLNADLVGLNLQIYGEVDKIVQGLEREAKVMALREDGIRRRLDEAKQRVVEAGGDDVKLRALESIARSKRAEFERLQGQLEAARTTSDAAAVPSEVQLIAHARIPTEKSSPKTVMMIAMAAVATALLGLAAIIVHALFTGARGGTAMPAMRGPLMRPDARPAAARLAANRHAPCFDSVATLARALADRAENRRGFRVMVATDVANAPIGGMPAELVRHLSRLGRAVLLLDWSPDGAGLAAKSDVPQRRGFADVLAGTASFEEVIAPLPGSSAHMITAGSALVTEALDRDRINMLLDALDEAYDHVVLAGTYGRLKELFKTIEGCIDAGVVVATPNATPAAGDFLGFHVADLDVIRYVGAEPALSTLAGYAAARAGSQGDRGTLPA
ncbi:MAG: exopolysaccharide transport family protein [Hyphomicrobiaceae bacterium]|nr:exopolysaccharide transport family protein [Hyphomicrobiaceae bacterium]